jgi:hypothetical protein
LKTRCASRWGDRSSASRRRRRRPRRRADDLEGDPVDLEVLSDRLFSLEEIALHELADDGDLAELLEVEVVDEAPRIMIVFSR